MSIDEPGRQMIACHCAVRQGHGPMVPREDCERCPVEGDELSDREQVLVPHHGTSPRSGWILGEEHHEQLGRINIVVFRSGRTARLTEREVVRQSDDGFGTYFRSRQEARDWMAFDDGDREEEESEQKFYSEPDRFREWEMWRDCLNGLSEDDWREIADAAFHRWIGRPLPVGDDFQNAFSDELDERAAELVLGRPRQ